MEAQKQDRRGCPPGQGIRPGLPFAPGQNPGLIGNPPYVPTDENREKVRTYAKVMSQEMIASALEVSVDTLRRHYRRELDAGKREAVASVGAKLLGKALAGNLTAMIFYLRTQGGWAARHELTGPGGGPLQTIDLTAFLADKSEQELGQIEQFLNALAAAGGLDVAGLLGLGDPASQDETAGA